MAPLPRKFLEKIFVTDETRLFIVAPLPRKFLEKIFARDETRLLSWRYYLENF
ncbi:hypothetical protein [Dulcicalothrix desertica]|uniref:hypothetical protein n=1 Tax=Dulcicalothrix desertica TaxID=32056 RepID=UPI0016447CC7|nr:hypothetical protein [Dulcicalothrix desertica]